MMHEEYRHLDGVTYDVIAELLHEEQAIGRKALGNSEIEGYGTVSTSLKEKIMRQTDLEQLGNWIKTAIRAKSIIEFEKII